MADNKKNIKAPAENKPAADKNEVNTDNEQKAKQTAESESNAKDANAKDANAKAVAEKAPDAKKEEDEDDLPDAGDLILENERQSVELNTKNAVFERSKGGLISMTLKHSGENEKDEFFERVIVVRSFPVTNPDEFLSVRIPESKQAGRSKEIGMIRHINDFDEATVKLFLEELDRRYFSPELTKIISVKEKFGYMYWDAETSAGHVTFILNSPFTNIRVLDDGRVYMYTVDGNCFEIPDPKKLDPASYHKIEIYL